MEDSIQKVKIRIKKAPFVYNLKKTLQKRKHLYTFS